ncbi:hypothetical protein [Pseudomonas sp. GW101-3H06]|uniref:hypothetical protein n=1 Tax=Pseudomonas sp. GW101-3H06 TaxID=2751347 RepID=UPI001A92EF97|nr:hypothetical protein [Pseudomonas sp. GW101-3H06]
MTSATRTSVLRKANKAELAALKDAAKEKFYNTQHGYDQFAFTDPKTLRPIGGMVKGAYTYFTVVYLTEILKTYIEKIELGYTLHELGAQPLTGHSVNIYFYRPQSEIDADLALIYEQVTQEYNAAIEAENTAIIEREVQFQMANTVRLRAEQKARDEQEEADRIRMEVEAELGATRKAVRDSLGAE